MTHARTVCQCWLGPRSDDPPEMWLELVPLPHLCHAQLAEVRQNSSGTSTILSVYCHFRLSHVLLWKLGPITLLVAVPRLGGWDTKIFSSCFQAK